MKKTILSFIIIIVSFSVNAQQLFGPENFTVDNILHGTSGSTSQWFAPSYNAPIDYISTGGCTGACAGFQGNWLNYWGNFLRTPAINCTGSDTVTLSFDLSNSYNASQPNDKLYFNMWIDGGYEDAVTNQTIYFDSIRNCVHYEVKYKLSSYIDLSAVLFYINASCGYNNSNTYSFKVDNIELIGSNGINTNLLEGSSSYDIKTAPGNISIINTMGTETLVRIFSISGQLLKQDQMCQQYTTNLKHGVYIIQLTNKGSTHTKKLFIP